MRTESVSLITDEGGAPVPIDDIEERDYRAYAERLGIEPSAPAPAAAPSRLTLVPTAEVEELRRMAASKPSDDPHDAEDDLYDRYAKLAGVRR